jgi:hypothetical protein
MLKHLKVILLPEVLDSNTRVYCMYFLATDLKETSQLVAAILSEEKPSNTRRSGELRF